MAKKATIVDVARLANVSQGTVTRYFQQKNVKKENIGNIERAIKELDYKIDYVARSLRSKKNYTIGVLVAVISEFTGAIINGIEDFFYKQGYSVIISCSNKDSEIEKNKLQFYLDKDVAGLIIFPYNQLNDSKELNLFKEKNIPVVCIDNMTEQFECDTVMVDNIESAYTVTNLLIQNGHRKIGVLAGRNDYYTSKERVEGYSRALKANGIEFSQKYLFSGEYDFDTGYQGLKAFMQLEDRPSAVLCINYDLTVGALTYITQNNIIIPDEVAIFGYDAEAISRIFKPNISVVTQPCYEIGQVAAKRLAYKIDNEDTGVRCIRLKTRQIITESILNPKKERDLSTR